MKRNMTFRYALIVMSYWASFACISAFASVYLLDFGFSNSTIGILLALACIFSALLQPFLTSWADRPGSPSLRKIAAVLGICSAAVCALIRVCSLIGAVSIAVAYILALILLRILQPIVSAIGMEAINNGHELNFGISRSGGSVGYAIISFGMGLMTARFSPRIIPLCSAGFFTLFIISVLTYPREENACRKASGAPPVNSARLFRKYRYFLTLLLGCVFLFCCHSIVNTFNLQIITSKGGSSSEMGTATAIAACIEIPGMILFSALNRKLRCGTLLMFSGLFFCLKCLASQLVPSIPSYYCIQIFQLFGWGIYAVASVRYVNSIMGPEDTVKGQGWLTVAELIGSVIGTIVGGFLIDRVGIPGLLIFGLCAGVVGTVLIGLCNRKIRIPTAVNQ